MLGMALVGAALRAFCAMTGYMAARRSAPPAPSRAGKRDR